MAELLALVGRGLLVLVGHLAPLVDWFDVRERRRRRTRADAIARGERVEIPCVLKDAELTGGAEQGGHLAVGGGKPVTWDGREFDPGALTMQAVDRQAITFHSANRRTELRVHPDEAAPILRALE
ncbi:hypothetical protein [Amycolatopsis albispora]|uniref:Uncharacterized protein n=1 Tax=Amycolatopsis albispora TaxID=1804986 RepID=A0A344L6T1_9PSEU|nr:hypothetical protein [Amycolatopsis albispora]AXB43755.1 hypothetical protein A4R43_15485 [Amycolatopsis albispora]